jgi:hypothetical protein
MLTINALILSTIFSILRISGAQPQAIQRHIIQKGTENIKRMMKVMERKHSGNVRAAALKPA